MTDEQTMQSVKDGAIASAGLLFERHHRRVYAYFVKVTHDRGLSEDLVQEVFVRVIRYAHTYRSDHAFQPWFYRIARNVLMDHHRKKRPVAVAPDAIVVSANDIDPVEQEEERNRIHRAIESLSENYREIVELSLFADLSYAEIAETLGISENNARVRFFRAVNSLRKHLGPEQ